MQVIQPSCCQSSPLNVRMNWSRCVSICLPCQSSRATLSHPCGLAFITHAPTPERAVSRPRSPARRLSLTARQTSHHSFHPDTMRWLQLLTASLLPFISLAAKKSSGDKYTDARAKSLSVGGPLKLDDGGYASLTKAPRDYSVAVLLNALAPQFGCQLCREFQPEWEILGKSWMKGDKKGESRLIFATLDFADGRNTFQSV